MVHFYRQTKMKIKKAFIFFITSTKVTETGIEESNEQVQSVSSCPLSAALQMSEAEGSQFEWF